MGITIGIITKEEYSYDLYPAFDFYGNAKKKERKKKKKLSVRRYERMKENLIDANCKSFVLYPLFRLESNSFHWGYFIAKTHETLTEYFNDNL